MDAAQWAILAMSGAALGVTGLTALVFHLDKNSPPDVGSLEGEVR